MTAHGPAHWLDFYDTHVIMCAWYYTSCCIQQTWNQTAKCTSLYALKYVLKYTTDCTRFYTPSLLDLRFQVSSEDAPKYTYGHVLKYTPEHALKDAPNCTQWHTPRLLDYTIPSRLSRRAQAHSRACPQGRSHMHSMAHSQPAWQYDPNEAHKMLSSTLPSTLSSTHPIPLDAILPVYMAPRSQVYSQEARHLNLTWLYASMYAPVCSIKRLAESQAPRTGRREAGDIWRAVFGGRRMVCGMWCVAGGGRCMVAEIKMSGDMIVWTLYLAWPPRQSLTMPHGQGVDNWSLRFCRKRRQ